MKLNWLRAGCASIAECGEYTAQCYSSLVQELGTRWLWDVYRTRDGRCVNTDGSGGGYPTREAAEAACEAWLDQHDKPVWHDVTDWLSWAEWRGAMLHIRPRHNSAPGWGWQVNGSLNAEWDAAKTREDAKAAAEKYVREQTA